MTNIISAIRHLDIKVQELEGHDVTILAIRVEENKESQEARFVVHCKMDEWYMTWADEYYHHRVQYTRMYDKDFVPFLDGEIFALIELEDV